MEEFDFSLLQDNYDALAAAAELGGLTVPATYAEAVLLTVGEALTLLDEAVAAIEALDPAFIQTLLDNPLFADDIPAEARPFLEQLAAGETAEVTGLVSQASAALSGYSADAVLADILAQLENGGGTVEVPADLAQAISDAQETLSTLLWQSVGAAFASPVFTVDEATGAWTVTGEAGVAYDGADLAALYATVGDAVSDAVLDFLASRDAVLQNVIDAGASSADLEAAAAAGQAAAQVAAERIQSFADLLAGAYDPAQVAFDAETAAAALRDAYEDALPAIGDALSGLIFGTRNSDPTFVVTFDGAVTGSERDDRFYLTEGGDSFEAGAGNDIVFGLGGNDTLEGGAGDDALFGGAGLDRAVFDGAAGDHLIRIVVGDTPQVVITGKGEGPGTDTLTDMEELQFGDGFSFHPDGAPLVDLTLLTGLLDGPVEVTPGEMAIFVQMYIAYFDRAPDVSGLLYWSERLSEGMTMAEIASSFFDQTESRALYPDPADDAALVTGVYNNYLERDPDAAGEAYWLEQLARDDYNRGQFMLDIISGTTGPDGSEADAAMVADKGDIGIYYSAIAGLNDPVGLALEVMDAYDRTDPETSLATAQGLIDSARSEAEAPGSDAVIIELVGFIDDPFAVA